MALVIHLKKGAQLIVNGAVLENVTGRPISLALKNDATILRCDDILSPDAAVTPASRVYYALQCAYLFRERRHEALLSFRELLDSYQAAAPSARPIADEVMAALAADDFYAALKKAQALIQHEGRLLSDVEERLVKELQSAPAAG